ncbi:MAG: amidohydrolase [Anaerovoracaceae bacterium]|jgi:amidohydrolase
MADRQGFEKQLIEWRHYLHRNPETAFNEKDTAAFLAKEFRTMGLDVTEGIGGTGLVAVLRRDGSGRVIGLRSDIDANPIDEQGDPEWKSTRKGAMHACGHDGHMAQLLGAAKILSESEDLKGTVCFVLQPAEEPGQGAQAIIDDGLFDRFPMDEIYGLHNIPAIPAGRVHVRAGGIMASEDDFRIVIRGKGAHASSPHMGRDPLLTAAEIIVALQTVVSRTANPLQPAVVSCTELLSDGAHNAIPSNVTILGDTRSYSPEMQALIEERMRSICGHICEMNGAGCEFEYTHEFAPTINSEEQADAVARAAARIVGPENVDGACEPVMISEDFAHYLEHVPGAFFFLGSGKSENVTENIMLHNANYDYNDSILVTGAEVLAETALSRLG